MRTTVDIPNALYRELKSKAAREKRSVKELILRGVAVELRPRSKKRTRRVTRLFPQRSQARSTSTMPRSTRSFLFPDSNVWLARSLLSAPYSLSFRTRLVRAARGRFTRLFLPLHPARTIAATDHRCCHGRGQSLEPARSLGSLRPVDSRRPRIICRGIFDARSAFRCAYPGRTSCCD